MVVAAIGKWQQQWAQQPGHDCKNERTMTTTKIMTIKHDGNDNQTSLVQQWRSMATSMAKVQQK